MPSFTVVLPHRRNPGNDAALRICLDCLYTNTVNDFVLISDAAYDQPLYERVNRMVMQATTEAVLYLASDTFLAPGWDAPMLELFDADTFVTGVLVEPGAIGLHPNNTPRDFGRKPETFRRADFEAWCLTDDAKAGYNEGWYCPVMYPREGYLEFGGLETNLSGDHQGFAPADIALFERWKFAGKSVKRADSYAYHLQRWSQEDEQLHPKREVQ